jgi:hypothetical protein
MEKSSSIIEITKAIVAVMKEVKGIEKSMTVGTGNNSYKGVSDKDVKNAIGKAMENNGLAIVPVGVEPTLQIDRWTETGGQYGDKQKQSVFTSVTTKYLLLHTSGEYIEISGYGHGTDTQDKAAGKATTYALKYTLLYTFMVPTGKIDDADATHSDDIEQPQAPLAELPWLNENSKEFAGAVEKIKAGKSNIEALKKYFRISKAVAGKINELTNQQNAA